MANRSPMLVDPGYYRNVMANDKIIALTFDDGPHPVKTRQIMEILDRQEVPATFFFTGSHALKYPDVVKETSNKGYEIGNHTFSHAYDVHHSQDRLTLELDVTNKIISNITGEETLLYRPPFLLDIGSDPIPDPDGHSEKLDWVENNGYIPIGADVDSLDWDAKSPEEIIDNVLNNVENGRIVLLHDGGEGLFTVDSLEPLIIELKSRDYRFSNVSDVIGLNASPTMLVDQNLMIGDTDATTVGNVSRLQLFLLKEGEFLAEPTGIFDKETQWALSSWQAKQNIVDEEGYVGNSTRDKILFNLNSYSQVPVVIDLKEVTYIERGIQRYSMNISALTEKQIPLLISAVLFLVIGKLILVTILFVFQKVRPTRYSGHWRGGVSVVIPVFNEAENIASTIESVLLNQRKKLEIIVVDDGSTDSTTQVVRKIRRKFKDKIKLIRINNSGKSEALNRGIAEARYGVVVTMDGDTVFDSHTISHLVNHFANPAVAGVSGKVAATGSNNFINIFQYLEYVIAQNIDKAAFNVLNAINVIPGPVGAWRKQVIVGLGGYSSQTIVEDQDLTLAVLAAGHRIVYEPKAIAYTETPFTIQDFIKQRMRWVFGTIQCFFKYLIHAPFRKSKSLRWIILPNTLLYSIVLPLLYPLMDVIFIFSAIFNSVENFWMVYALFILIDFGYALIAFSGERSQRRLLLWLPLQRFFYRFIVYYVVTKSMLKLIEGSENLWNKVKKRGDASRYHLDLIKQRVQVEVVTTN